MEQTASTSRPAPTPRGSGSGARWSWAWVALSSVAIAAYFVGQYASGSLSELAGRQVGLAPVYAARPWPIQIAFWVHIVSAGLALAVGPLQFSRRLRAANRLAHRWIGRSYVLASLVGAGSGLVMSMASSVGLLGFFGFGSLSVVWGWATWRGFRAAAYERDFRAHQAWMIRSFALTYGAVTLRLWFALLVLAQLPFTTDLEAVLANAYAPLAFVAWLPNLVVAELMIRRRRLPGLYYARGPAQPTPVPSPAHP